MKRLILAGLALLPLIPAVASADGINWRELSDKDLMRWVTFTNGWQPLPVDEHVAIAGKLAGLGRPGELAMRPMIEYYDKVLRDPAAARAVSQADWRRIFPAFIDHMKNSKGSPYRWSLLLRQAFVADEAAVAAMSAEQCRALIDLLGLLETDRPRAIGDLAWDWMRTHAAQLPAAPGWSADVLAWAGPLAVYAQGNDRSKYQLVGEAIRDKWQDPSVRGAFSYKPMAQLAYATSELRTREGVAVHGWALAAAFRLAVGTPAARSAISADGLHDLRRLFTLIWGRPDLLEEADMADFGRAMIAAARRGELPGLTRGQSEFLLLMQMAPARRVVIEGLVDPKSPQNGPDQVLADHVSEVMHHVDARERGEWIALLEQKVKESSGSAAFGWMIARAGADANLQYGDANVEQQWLIRAMEADVPAELKLAAGWRLVNATAVTDNRGPAYAPTLAALRAMADKSSGSDRITCDVQITQVQRSIEAWKLPIESQLKYYRDRLENHRKSGHTEAIQSLEKSIRNSERDLLLGNPRGDPEAQQQALDELVREMQVEAHPMDIAAVDKKLEVLRPVRRRLNPKALATCDKAIAELEKQREEVLAGFVDIETARYFAKIRSHVVEFDRQIANARARGDNVQAERLEKSSEPDRCVECFLDPRQSAAAQAEAVGKWYEHLKKEYQAAAPGSWRPLVAQFRAMVERMPAASRRAAAQIEQKRVDETIAEYLRVEQESLKRQQQAAADSRARHEGHAPRTQREADAREMVIGVLKLHGLPGQKAALQKLAQWAEAGSTHPKDCRRDMTLDPLLGNAMVYLCGDSLDLGRELHAQMKARIAAGCPRQDAVHGQEALLSDLDKLEMAEALARTPSSGLDGAMRRAEAMDEVERLKRRIAVLGEWDEFAMIDAARELVNYYLRTVSHPIDSESFIRAKLELDGVSSKLDSKRQPALSDLKGESITVMNELRDRMNERSQPVVDKWSKRLRQLKLLERYAPQVRLDTLPCHLQHEAALMEALLDLCDNKCSRPRQAALQKMPELLKACMLHRRDPAIREAFDVEVDLAVKKMTELKETELAEACRQVKVTWRRDLAPALASGGGSELLTQRLRELAVLRMQLVAAREKNNAGAVEVLSEAIVELEKEIAAIEADEKKN